MINPLSFSDVRQLHGQTGGAFGNLNEFSQLANQLTGTNVFDAGVGNRFENTVKSASDEINLFLDRNAGGAEEWLGERGADLFEFFGADEATGRQVGEEALRGVVDFLPAIAGFGITAATGGAAGPIAIPLGLASSAALAGANTLEQTDSYGQAALSAGLAGFGGGVASLGARGTLSALGRGTTQKILSETGEQVGERLIAQTLGDRALAGIAGETTINLAAMLGSSGIKYAETGEFENPFTKEEILSNLVDPTLIFGINEMVNPSVISERYISRQQDKKKYTSAEQDEQAAKIAAATPTSIGKTREEILRTSSELYEMARNIEDENVRESMMTVVSKLREEAYAAADAGVLSAEEVPTVLGEVLYTELEDYKTNSTVEPVATEEGTVMQELSRETLVEPEALEAFGRTVEGFSFPGEASYARMLDALEPKNDIEFKERVLQANVVRQEMDMSLIDDESLKAFMGQATEQKKGNLEEAVDVVGERVRSETEAAVKGEVYKAQETSIKDVKEVVGKFVQLPEEVQDTVGDVQAVVKSAKVDEQGEVILKLENPTGEGPDLTFSGNEVRYNGKAVVVSKLDKAQDAEAAQAQEAVAESGRIVPGSPEDIVAKAKEKANQIAKKKKKKGKKYKNPFLDPDFDESEVTIDLDKYDLTEDEQDRLDVETFLEDDAADWDDLDFFGGDAENIAKPDTKDIGVGVTLAHVLGKHKDTGNLMIGDYQFSSNKSPLVDERIVKKQLMRYGMKASTWEAYKLKYDTLVKDGEVDLQLLMEISEYPLLDVDVHGGVEVREKATDEPRRRIDEFRHSVETELGSEGFDALSSAFRTGSSVERALESSLVSSAQKAILRENRARIEALLPEYERLTDAYNDADYADYKAENEDFAERFGDIAPDEFQPFDPKTGLGNVAYVIRADGVENGGGHTGNDDTLAWVRGKFILADDAFVDSTLDQIPLSMVNQNDTNKVSKTLQALKRMEKPTAGDLVDTEFKTREELVKYVEKQKTKAAELRQELLRQVDANRIFRVDEVQSDAAQGAAQRQKREDANRTQMLSHLGEKASVLSDHLRYSYGIDASDIITRELVDSVIPNYSHPLFSNYETIALRTAIQKARENGATKLFMPDSNTAMMTERHDAASLNGQNFAYRLTETQRKEFVEFYDNIKDFDQGDGRRTYTAQDGSWLFDVFADGRIVTNNPDIKRHLETVGTRFYPEPSQAPGMRAAYDERLQNIARKQLGVGNRADLGRHKDSPLEPLEVQQERLNQQYEEGLISEAEAEAAFPLETREPTLFNPDGTPHTNVTGRIYDVPSHIGLDGARTGRLEGQVVATPKDLLTRILRKKGWTNKSLEESHETFSKIFDLLDANEVTLSTIENSNISGAASRTAQKLFLGKQDSYEAAAFVTGHELAHLVEQLDRKGLLSKRHHNMMRELTNWTKDASEQDRRLALEIMRDGMLSKKFRDTEVVRQAMDTVSDPAEVRANLISMWAMNRAHKPDEVAMNLLPAPIQRGLRVLTDLMRDVVGAMKGTSNTLVNFRSRRDMRKKLDRLTKDLDAYQRAQQKQREFWTESQKLLAMGPQGFDVKDSLDFFGGKFESQIPDDSRGFARKAFDKWILQFDQLTRMIPSFQGVGSDLHAYSGNVNAVMKRIAGKIMGEVDAAGNAQFSSRDDSLKFERVKKSPKLQSLRDDWMRAQNTHAKELSFGDLAEVEPELHKKLKDLKPSEREAVIHIKSRMSAAMKEFTDVEIPRIVRASNEALVTNYIASRYPDSLRENAMGLSNVMYEALTLMKSGDPASVEAGRTMLQKVASEFPDSDGFAKAYELAEKGFNGLETLKAQFKKKPYFFSEIRTGKFFVRWKDKDGKTGGAAFDSAKEAKAFEAKELKARGKEVIMVEGVRRGQPHFVGEDRVVSELARMDALNKSLVDSMTTLSDEQKQRLKAEFNYASEFEKDLMASDIIKNGSRRKLSDGRQYLDMFSTQMAYWNSATRKLNKKLFYHRYNYRQSDPAWRNDEKVAAHLGDLDQHIKNFFEPDTKIGKDIVQANAAYFLGLNFSSHAIELTQPVNTYVPELIARGESFLGAMKYIIQAEKEVGKFSALQIPSNLKRLAKVKLPFVGRLTESDKQKAYKGIDNHRFWDNKDYGELMEYAAERGEISMSWASEVIEPDPAANSDLSGLAMRGGEKSKNPLARWGITPAMNLARNSLKLYQQFTQYNARVALIAGYNKAKADGLDHKAAMESALEFARVVTYSGGKANRPVAMFEGTGAFRGLGQAMYSLQGYNFGVLSMMRRYGETAFNKTQYPDMTPTDRKNARKALTAMVIAQFASAGLVGLPFVGSAMALLEKYTGLEIEKEAREGLAGLLEDDEREDGGILADLILNGAANTFSKEVLPGAPDFASRLAVGGVMGLNPYDGWSLGQLMGPTGSIVENVSKGAINLIREGNPGQALEDVVPIAWKKPIHLLRHGGELRDSGGGKLIDANFGEKVAYAIGFTPQRIDRERTINRLQRKHEDVIRRKGIKVADSLSEMPASEARKEIERLAWSSEKVQMALDMGATEKAFSEFESEKQRLSGLVADRAEKEAFPRDARREATFKGSAGQEALLRSMGYSNEPSEVARLLKRAEVQSQLGSKPNLNQRSVMRASLIDRLMEDRPYLSRVVAAQIADQLLATL